MELGEKSTGGSRIILQDKAGEDEQLPVLDSPIPGAAADDSDHGPGPSGECYRLPLPELTFMQILMPLRTRWGRCRHWRQGDRVAGTIEAYVSTVFWCWLPLNV